MTFFKLPDGVVENGDTVWSIMYNTKDFDWPRLAIFKCIIRQTGIENNFAELEIKKFQYVDHQTNDYIFKNLENAEIKLVELELLGIEGR